MKLLRSLSLATACVVMCLFAGCSAKDRVPSSQVASSSSAFAPSPEGGNAAGGEISSSDSSEIPDRPILPSEDLEEDNSIEPEDFRSEMKETLNDTVVHSEVGTAGSSFKVSEKAVTLLKWAERNEIAGKNHAAFLSAVRHWSSELTDEEKEMFLEGWEEVLSAAYTISEHPTVWTAVQEDFGVSPVEEAPTCDPANLDTLYAALCRVANALEDGTGE